MCMYSHVLILIGRQWLKSAVLLRVLLDMGSETRRGAERTPSGLTNHPKYHSHSSDVSLCCRNLMLLSVCLPLYLAGLCKCLSVCLVWQLTRGTSLQWQMTQTWVGFEAFGTAVWPNQDLCLWFSGAWRHAYGTIQLYAGFDFTKFYSLLSASSSCLFDTDNWFSCSHEAITTIIFSRGLNWTSQPGRFII